MPKITVRLSSHRGRAATDPPEQVKIKGTHYVHPLDIDYFDGGFVADLVPGRYVADVRMDGFERNPRALRAYANEPKEHSWRFEHRCDRLPTFRDLDEEQRRLLESFAGEDRAASWDNLSDNRACTFFQITYALVRTPVAGRRLSDYIDSVERIGGAQIEGPSPDGETKRAVGWRMHVTIVPEFMPQMVDDIESAGFEAVSGVAHPTHTKFGYTRSYRQTGKNPKLQLVFMPSANDPGGFVGADVDLDRGFLHKSSFYDIYRSLIRKFPEVEEIYHVS
jgi:hypothetical protein